jgi:uncharacterized damage-inducible protein DinB
MAEEMLMDIRELDELFEYDDWATNRLLDAAGRVSEDDFTSRKGHGIGSVRELITHQGDAVLRWLERLEGGEAQPRDANRFDSVAQVRAHCTHANRSIRDWIARQDAATLAGDLHYKSAITGGQAKVGRGKLMLQLITHGVHHRAEASELLTAAGSAPAPLDLVQFYQRND